MRTVAVAHALAGAAAAVGAGGLAQAARRVCDAPDEDGVVALAQVAGRSAVALGEWSVRYEKTLGPRRS